MPSAPRTSRSRSIKNCRLDMDRSRSTSVRTRLAAAASFWHLRGSADPGRGAVQPYRSVEYDCPGNCRAQPLPGPVHHICGPHRHHLMLVNVITRYPRPVPAMLEQTLVENGNAFGGHSIAVAKRYLLPAVVQSGQAFGKIIPSALRRRCWNRPGCRTPLRSVPWGI